MSQHGTIHFARRPPSPGDRVSRSKFNYFRTWYVAYQIKGNREWDNMVANILPADPTLLTLGMGSDGHNSTFPEHDHVAYQIKKNHEQQQHGSKYFAPDLGVMINRSKFVFFRTCSCQIKWDHKM